MGDWEQILKELAENDFRHGGFIKSALDEIESLRARVQELEADNKEMNSHLSRIGAILDDVDYLGEHSVGVQALKNRVVELEAGMGEPVGIVVCIEHLYNGKFAHTFVMDTELPFRTPLFRTPPTVSAALRKAAEVCWNLRIVECGYCVEEILSIPHDDSALREFGLAVINAWIDKDLSEKETVDFVLGEKK